MAPRNPEPRAHHFTPQCWLAGFTNTGLKDGRLFVTDLRRQKQWQTTPPNAGHRRDFYRVTEPKLDPVWFERCFSNIEDVAAPVFRDLYDRPQEPRVEAMDVLMYFAAIQYIRVPAFRPVLLNVADSINRSMIAGALKTPETWAQALKKAGIRADAPGASYQSMLAFEQDVIGTGQYTISAENDFFLVRGFKLAASAVYPALHNRYWQTLISPSGSFVGSDNPVAMDGPKGQRVGFKSAEIIIFTVNRFLALYGTNLPLRRPLVNRRLIAKHNTFAMITADEQIYSHAPDFCWLDATGRVQTEWRSFIKEGVLESVPA
jgi:hypothetical protein